MTRLPRWLLALALATIAWGCGGADGEAPPTGDDSPRIAVMAPAAAEMLEALGVADRIVGVGDFVTSPEGVATLPRLGAYNAPNVERVLSLEATVLMTAASEAAGPSHRRLEDLGVEVLALDTSTYDGVFEALTEVGRAVGRDDAADELTRSMRAELDAMRNEASGLEPLRVLFVVGRDPMYVAGPGSHVDEMIAAVGATNVAHDAMSPYQKLSTEALLERLPEVIIDTSDNRPDASRGRVAGTWGQWEFLPAVQNDRVYHVAPSRLVIPGIRLPEMTRLVGKIVRPEVFGEPTDAEYR
jgi:iron complex transport system substrate-binding protein